jgi:hypothetical protein
VSKRIEAWTLILAMSTLLAAPSRAADDVSLLKDLTAVIALLGLPCGQVVKATRLKDNDHLATCKDKNRYRVFMNSEGRRRAETIGCLCMAKPSPRSRLKSIGSRAGSVPGVSLVVTTAAPHASGSATKRAR